MFERLQAYAAIVFDFDGTLIDSYSAIAASVNFIRGEHGLPALTEAEVREFVGRGPDFLLSHTVPQYRPELDLPRYREHHPRVMLEKTSLLPGAAEVLPALHQAGKRLGLCSNKLRVFSTELLRHLGIADYFEIVLGPEDVARPKPAPDMLLAALQRFNLPAGRVLYVGDMTVDVETARAAGVDVWVVPSGSDDRDTLTAARPDRLLESLRDIVAGMTLA